MLNYRILSNILVWCVFLPVLTTGQPSLRTLYKQISPSVVVIKTTESHILGGNAGQVSTASGLGSGVLIEGNRILTSAHVVQTADNIIVEFIDGSEYMADVEASVPYGDVALLRLYRKPQHINPVRIGNSDSVYVGDQVFVIGAPYGLSHTLSVGHISGRLQPNKIGAGFTNIEFFQTDAAINQGNSGGPMFNSEGEVIGIVSHILSQSGGFEGIGFVATSNATRELLIDRPSAWTGISGILLSDEMSAMFNIPQRAGLLIQKVAGNSPAYRMGLRGGTLSAQIGDEELLLGGDVVLTINNISLADPGSLEEIQEMLRSLGTNQAVNIKILRGGAIRTLKGTLKN